MIIYKAKLKMEYQKTTKILTGPERGVFLYQKNNRKVDASSSTKKHMTPLRHPYKKANQNGICIIKDGRNYLEKKLISLIYTAPLYLKGIGGIKGIVLKLTKNLLQHLYVKIRCARAYVPYFCRLALSTIFM